LGNYVDSKNFCRVVEAGTGTKSKRTGSGTRTFKILRTETFILINKEPAFLN